MVLCQLAGGERSAASFRPKRGSASRPFRSIWRGCARTTWWRHGARAPRSFMRSPIRRRWRWSKRWRAFTAARRGVNAHDARSGHRGAFQRRRRRGLLGMLGGGGSALAQVPLLLLCGRRAGAHAAIGTSALGVGANALTALAGTWRGTVKWPCAFIVFRSPVRRARSPVSSLGRPCRLVRLMLASPPQWCWSPSDAASGGVRRRPGRISACPSRCAFAVWLRGRHGGGSWHRRLPDRAG